MEFLDARLFEMVPFSELIRLLTRLVGVEIDLSVGVTSVDSFLAVPVVPSE